MRPRSLPTTYATPDERDRRVAETVNALVARTTDGDTSTNRPVNPPVGTIFYDQTLVAWIGWDGTAWRWVGSGELVP